MKWPATGLLICLISFYHQDVCSEDNYMDDNEFAKVMKRYEMHPIYQKVKDEFLEKYGNKTLTVLQKMDILLENLRSFYNLTKGKIIPEDLKSIFRQTLNGLKPDFKKLDHQEGVLKSMFYLRDHEIAAYRRMYSEARSMFAELDDRFQIEADC
uniref:Uncharacterized protein n=1 Tax=Cuerna arida TaxID=1464854 RepID=A0A1B6F140_9HEMI